MVVSSSTQQTHVENNFATEQLAEQFRLVSFADQTLARPRPIHPPARPSMCSLAPALRTAPTGHFWEVSVQTGGTQGSI